MSVERYANCRAYGPNAGVADETTATRKLREAREQRLRDAREQQQTLSPTPAPAPATAKPAVAHVDVGGQHHPPRTHSFVPPLYQRP
eukprot:6201521-Pleurochrysis_carterae.AAC.3